MNDMITCELKDRILKEIVEKGTIDVIDPKEKAILFDVDSITYEQMLDHFERLGYISQVHMVWGGKEITVKIEAHDFIRRGGFFVQEEILKGNIEKLGLEIDSLAKQLSVNTEFTERAKTIATIGSAILGAYNILRGA